MNTKTNNNAVHCIAPYRHPQCPSVWVFDDPRYELEQEPFVGSANYPFNDMNTQLNAGGKLIVYFSATPIPGANLTLTSVSKRHGARTHGCSYYGEGTAGTYDGLNEIWLCPALMHYFNEDLAPEKIYARFEAATP